MWEKQVARIFGDEAEKGIPQRQNKCPPTTRAKETGGIGTVNPWKRIEPTEQQQPGD